MATKENSVKQILMTVPQVRAEMVANVQIWLETMNVDVLLDGWARCARKMRKDVTNQRVKTMQCVLISSRTFSALAHQARMERDVRPHLKDALGIHA